MNGHGGARKGAGRPKKGQTTTKATIYRSDRELINGYALSQGVPVNELLHRIFRHEKFEQFFETVFKQEY